MSKQYRRIKFYRGPPQNEPPAPNSITNAFSLISDGDQHCFHQIHGEGHFDDAARQYPNWTFNDLDCAKEAINNLPQNHNLKYVTYLMKQFSP